MKSYVNVTALTLAAICFTARSLAAADCSGSFTVRSQTHWGLAVLPAGDYTFSFDRDHGIGVIMVSREGKRVGMILSPSSSLASTSGGSSMQIVGNRVRSLHLALLGLTFDYPSHERQKEALARSAGVVATVVPVTAK